MVLLVSGGSIATLTGLAVARHVQLKVRLVMDVRTSGLQSVERRIPVHMSTEGHSRIHKAVALLGLGSDNLRVGPEGPAALVRDLGTQLAGGGVGVLFVVGVRAEYNLPCLQMTQEPT